MTLPPGRDRRRARKPISLLLVEDDETDVCLIRRCLAKHGGNISLVVARDGEEALALLRDDSRLEKPYVILTDLNMPGMSGHELIEEVRGDDRLKNSVIIVFSSSYLAEDVTRVYRHNVAGYLLKEMQPERMAKSLGLIFDYCETMYLPG